MALTITQLRQKVIDDLADFSNIVPSKVRGVDDEIINFLEELENKGIPLQTGYINGLNVGQGLTGYGGAITNVAHTVGPEDESLMVCTLATPVVGNYKVSIDIEASTGTILTANDVLVPVYEIISSTQFRVGLKESAPGTQNITLHMEIKKLDY